MEKELTFGEKACGVSFNPGGNETVAVIKAKFADIVDELNDIRNDTTDCEVARMLSIAITESQTAQMWAVKAVTWNK
jgi:hypothetical protein